MSEPSQRTLRNSPKRAAREERLARALRDNLRRRKEQARAQQRPGASSEKPRGGERPA